MTTPHEHTTIIRGDTPVVAVRFAGGDEWIGHLSSLIDSGSWAGLSPAARSVLVVLCRHARDGVSSPPRARLERESGLSRTSVFRAIGELGRHRIVQERPNKSWELFPGRPLVARQPTVPPCRGGTGGDGGVGPPIAEAECPSRQRNILFHQRDDSKISSHQWNKTVPPVEQPYRGWDDSARALRVKDKELTASSSSSLNPKSQKETTTLTTMLVQLAGMREDEARGAVSLHGPERVRDALDSLEAVVRGKRLKQTPIRFVRWFLAQGVGVFSDAVDLRVKRADIARRDRFVSLVRARAARDGVAGTLASMYDTIGRLYLHGPVGKDEMDAMSDDEIWAAVLARLRVSPAAR